MPSFPQAALWEGAGRTGEQGYLAILASSEQDQGEGGEAQVGDSSKLLVIQQHVTSGGMQQGEAGSSRTVSYSSRAVFAWWGASSFPLQAARWWPSCPLSTRTRTSSKQPLLLPVLGEGGAWDIVQK